MVLFPYLQDSKSGSVPSLDKDDRLSEQQKYGIYFDDDYDYLQHLKEPGATVLEPVGDSLQSATDGKVHVCLCSLVPGFSFSHPYMCGPARPLSPYSGIPLFLTSLGQLQVS